MAAEGGIDRKAEERMEFNTSKDVVVTPTFSDSEFLPRSFFAIWPANSPQCT